MRTADDFEVRSLADRIYGNDTVDPAEADELKRAQNDAVSLLSSAQARRWIWQTISACGIYSRGRIDEFQQGRRDVGLAIMAQLKDHAPDQYRVMLAENGDVNTEGSGQ